MTKSMDFEDRPVVLETLKEQQQVRREYEAAKQSLDRATRNLIAIETRVAQMEILQKLERKRDGTS